MNFKGTKKFKLSEYNELIDLSDYEMNTHQAIMTKCKECSGFSSHEAVLCNCKTCALHKIYQHYVRNSKLKINKDNKESKF